MGRYVGLQSFLVMANGLSIASCQQMKVMYSLFTLWWWKITSLEVHWHKILEHLMSKYIYCLLYTICYTPLSMTDAVAACCDWYSTSTTGELTNCARFSDCSELPGRSIQAVIDSNLVLLGSSRKQRMTVAAAVSCKEYNVYCTTFWQGAITPCFWLWNVSAKPPPSILWIVPE